MGRSEIRRKDVVFVLEPARLRARELRVLEDIALLEALADLPAFEEAFL